jgi:predicted nucleic acid-binding protein
MVTWSRTARYRDHMFTGRHSWLETSLALGRVLDGEQLAIAREDLEQDWRRMLVVALDDQVCRQAARMAEMTRARSMDALHLACADRAGARSIALVTFDLRLANAARSLGFLVLGS